MHYRLPEPLTFIAHLGSPPSGSRWSTAAFDKLYDRVNTWISGKYFFLLFVSLRLSFTSFIFVLLTIFPQRSAQQIRMKLWFRRLRPRISCRSVDPLHTSLLIIIFITFCSIYTLLMKLQVGSVFIDSFNANPNTVATIPPNFNGTSLFFFYSFVLIYLRSSSCGNTTKAVWKTTCVFWRPFFCQTNPCHSNCNSQFAGFK